MGSDNVNNTQSPSELAIQSIYVWDYGPILTTNIQAQERFFDQVHDLDLNTIFLSWGALQTTSTTNLASFIKTSHEQGLQVHALIGTAGDNAVANAEESVPRIIEYNRDQSFAAKFDGIHLNIEPRDTDLNEFLDKYQILLDKLLDEDITENDELTVSAAVGWWWGNTSSKKTVQLVEHEIFDYITIMAYWNTEQEIRNRLEPIVSDTEVSYVLAVETQEFAKDTTNKNVTFYEQGESAVNEVLSNIESNPPTPEFSGFAYHYFQSSVSKWNLLRRVELNKEYLSPKDKLDINITVAFDDDFPDSAHRSEIIVKFSSHQSEYTTSKIIEPPGRQLENISLSWIVPPDIEPDTYSCEVIINDIVFVDTNREAISKRSNPVELDRRSVDEVEII